MKRLLFALSLAFLALRAEAAISFIGASTCVSDEADTVMVTPHASTTTDDYVILFVSTNGTTSNPASASGFTQWAHHFNAGGAPDRNFTVLYRKSSGSESAITVGATSAGDITAAAITLRGVDGATPIDVTYVDGSHSVDTINDANGDPAAITTATDGAWVLVAQSFNNDNLSVIGPPTNYTARLSCGAGGHQNPTLVFSREIASAGAENPGVTTNTGGTTEDQILLTLAVKPAADSGGASSLLPRRRRSN